jgi:hypothetical protein
MTTVAIILCLVLAGYCLVLRSRIRRYINATAADCQDLYRRVLTLEAERDQRRAWKKWKWAQRKEEELIETRNRALEAHGHDPKAFWVQSAERALAMHLKAREETYGYMGEHIPTKPPKPQDDFYLCLPEVRETMKEVKALNALRD